MVLQRNSSLDVGYSTGNLSLFPDAIDTQNQLYVAKNNAETVLQQSLTYNGKYIILKDASSFPDKGLVKIGPTHGKEGIYEIVYYDTKTGNTLKNLIRGFAGSRQNQWDAGVWVGSSVMAEYHNSVKDAIIQIQTKLGKQDFPDDESLNGILKTQEVRFLAPKPLFRAFPIKGPPPLTVRFQNFSNGPVIRYLWDFGDGTTSVEKHPQHVYQTEGIYSVKLNIISSLGAQGVVTKSNYITVSEEERLPFFYATPSQGYSKETAEELDIEPTTFTFVDQTDGNITQRYWVFDGPGTHEGVQVEGQSLAVYDPNIHTTSYVFDKPGSYEPSLLILFESQALKRAFLRDKITVS